MRIIDCHTHAFPDSIAERALDSLARNYGRTPSFDGTIAGLLRRMDHEKGAGSLDQRLGPRPS